MFQYIVTENDIKAFVRKRDLASVRDPPLVKKRVIYYAWIKIDSTNAAGKLTKIHLINDPSTGT